MKLLAQVSPGELIDKITILEIKCANITDASKLTSASYELRLLHDIRAAHISDTKELLALTLQLKNVNEVLWRIEDEIREHERAKKFDDAFIALSRSVYRTNDKRAALKQDINTLLSSSIQEVKSYQTY